MGILFKEIMFLVVKISFYLKSRIYSVSLTFHLLNSNKITFKAFILRTEWAEFWLVVGHVRSSEVITVTPNLTTRRNMDRLKISTSSKTHRRLEVTDQTVTLKLERKTGRYRDRLTAARTLVDPPPEGGNLNRN